MKIRTFPDKNYRAIFFNGKTIRQKLDGKKSFLPLEYPELEDWGLNTKCLANCSYCYTSAIKEGKNFSHIIDKVLDLYDNLDENKKPFQVAIGGSGEPTLHPDFIEFVKTVKQLEIMPNYTTNGMHITDALLEVTEKVCGGVALSYHPHIEKVFLQAYNRFKEIKTKFNIHFILGEKGSFEKFLNFKDKLDIDYFVILPYQAVGRGKEIEVETEWKKFFDWIKTNEIKNIAFGALFYDYLKKNEAVLKHLDLDIYEPEQFSGYRLFDKSYRLLRKSSYDLMPKFEIKESTICF